MVKRSSDDCDLEDTDELPILLETVGLSEDAGGIIDDTADHTALYHRLGENEANDAQLREDRAAVSEEIEALEAQLRGIADLNRELERRLAERDLSIADLERSLAALRGTAEAAAGAERQLATQLALRDARLAELSGTVERLRDEAAARSAELEQLRTAAEAAQQAAEAARREAPAAPAVSGRDAEIATLREENAALSSYIDGRRRWWNELQTAHGELALKVSALSRELAAGEQQRAAAADLAARESRRATTFRAELAASARRVEELERELKEARTAGVAAAPRTGEGPTGVPPAPPLPATAEAAVEAIPAATSPVASTEAKEPAPAATEAAPSVEAIAQLEAEVAYKREQVAAQLVELHEREQRLRSASDELERLRQEHTTLRGELEEQRAATARLEQRIIDKDRALAARDSRIESLQEELARRASPVEDPNVRPPAPPQPGSIELGTGTGVPALLCLTGDAPPRFPLTKETITVGRGEQCDLQILTHFVSREHARISTSRDGAIIEDLGSRNGVYVNSVRVDRQVLRQGDLLIIGETQFRFVESMAH